MEIRRGMYGLKEAGVIAFDQIVRKLKRFGYKPMSQTPGLWKHTSRRTAFTLCVDNFGVHYFSKDDTGHLIDAIRATYECSIDWEGTQYCCLTLAWNYPEEYVDISMPGYVKKALKKLNHKPPQTPRARPARLDSPHIRPAKSTTSHPSVYRPTSPDQQKSTHPSDRGHLPLLRPQHQLHHTHNPKQDRRPTINSNTRH